MGGRAPAIAGGSACAGRRAHERRGNGIHPRSVLRGLPEPLRRAPAGQPPTLKGGQNEPTTILFQDAPESGMAPAGIPTFIVEADWQVRERLFVERVTRYVRLMRPGSWCCRPRSWSCRWRHRSRPSSSASYCPPAPAGRSCSPGVRRNPYTIRRTLRRNARARRQHAAGRPDGPALLPDVGPGAAGVAVRGGVLHGGDTGPAHRGKHQGLRLVRRRHGDPGEGQARHRLSAGFAPGAAAAGRHVPRRRGSRSRRLAARPGGPRAAAGGDSTPAPGSAG